MGYSHLSCHCHQNSVLTRLEMSSLFINNARSFTKSPSCVLNPSILERDEVQQHVLSAKYVDQPILEAEIAQGFVQIFS